MWFIIALVVGAGVTALIFWTRSRGIKVSWYEWLIGIVGFLLVLVTIQNYFGSVAEHETTAAGRYLLAFGIPAVILMALAGMLAWRRQRAS